MSNLISLYYSYSQLAVFQARLKNPFNNWEQQHVRQGFSWRPASVSFKMLDEEGEVECKIVSVQTFKELQPNTIRAIRVPFEVPNDGEIEIASISDGITASIKPGKCTLVFETGYKSGSDDVWCQLSFVNQFDLPTEILICDKDLIDSKPYLMQATPAYTTFLTLSIWLGETNCLKYGM